MVLNGMKKIVLPLLVNIVFLERCLIMLPGEEDDIKEKARQEEIRRFEAECGSERALATRRQIHGKSSHLNIHMYTIIVCMSCAKTFQLGKTIRK